MLLSFSSPPELRSDGTARQIGLWLFLLQILINLPFENKVWNAIQTLFWIAFQTLFWKVWNAIQTKLAKIAQDLVKMVSCLIPLKSQLSALRPLCWVDIAGNDEHETSCFVSIVWQACQQHMILLRIYEAGRNLSPLLAGTKTLAPGRTTFTRRGKEKKTKSVIT